MAKNSSLDDMIDQAMSDHKAMPGVDQARLTAAVQRMLAAAGLPPETEVSISPPKSWQSSKRKNI
jgi:hypothetical protein